MNWYYTAPALLIIGVVLGMIWYDYRHWRSEMERARKEHAKQAQRIQDIIAEEHTDGL